MDLECFIFFKYCDLWSFNVFVDSPQNNSWILGGDIYERVQFGADLNKNLDLVNLNVVSTGDGSILASCSCSCQTCCMNICDPIHCHRPVTCQPITVDCRVRK